MPPVQRPRYFDHQFLKVEDFTLETEYHLDMRRRHNRDLHTPGVADGLTVAGSSGATSVTVAPGVALDGQGREIVLVDPRTVTLPTGVTSAQLYIVYAEEETDQVTAAGVTGNRRFAEDPAVVVSPPAAAPPDGIPLASLALNNGQLTAPPNNAVRQSAASVVTDDLPLRSVILRQDGVPPAQWPRLRCAGANLASLEAANLRLESGREIFFQDNGQIRSLDQNHRLVFNRANNRLELYEIGDILFFTGGPTPTEKVRIQASGRVGIGLPDPDAPLHVAGGNWDVGATEGDLKIGDDSFRVKIGVARGGAGAGDVRIRAQGGTNRLMLGGGTGDTLTIQGSNVGIGTITPTERLQIQGNLALSGNVSVSGLVLQDAWIAPTLLNGWVNYSTEYNSAGYFRDKQGIVHLRGLVKTGTIGSIIFNLPAGYRPEHRELMVVQTNPNTVGRCDVDTSGNIIAFSGNNAWFSLDGITFRAVPASVVIGPVVVPGPVIVDPVLKIKG
jgi:hypothetical protein